MNDTIKIKRGGGTTRLGEYEIGYNTKTGIFTIGTANGNVPLCKAGDIARIEQLVQEVEELKATLNAQ